MPRTRSAKVAASQSDGDLLDPADSSSAPATSFQGELSKYKYAASSDTTAQNNTAVSGSAKQSSQRTRATVRKKSSDASFSVGKRRKISKYAAPSKYAHLSPLVDILEPNLIGIFIGFNPGVQTATAGHAYAHPSNHFWKLLHSSGLTDRRLKPEEDRSLPALYCMGNTNIVSRPSKDMAELSKEEMSAGTEDLDTKILEFKPESACIVGKGIWEAIWRYRYGKKMKKEEFKYGWQDQEHNMGKSKDGEQDLDAEGNVWKGARVFVATATSGLAASLKPAEKEAIWKPYGEWVEKRRAERGFKPRVAES